MGHLNTNKTSKASYTIEHFDLSEFAERHCFWNFTSLSSHGEFAPNSNFTILKICVPNFTVVHAP